MKKILVAFLIGLLVTVAAAAQTFEGSATWYTTDSGSLTASHEKLPFGTWVRVTNLLNSKQIVVVITNRILETPEKIVDISEAAAEDLKMHVIGPTPIRMEVVSRRADHSPLKTPHDVSEEYFSEAKPYKPYFITLKDI
jgi:rare lipoprotein A